MKGKMPGEVMTWISDCELERLEREWNAVKEQISIARGRE